MHSEIGRINTLRELGLIDEQTKLAYFEKIGALPGLVVAGTRLLARPLAALGRYLVGKATNPWAVAKAGKSLGLGGQAAEAGRAAVSGLGGLMKGTSGGMLRAAHAWNRNPFMAVGGGLKNFGKGMLFDPKAKGVGNVAAKGTIGYSMLGGFGGGGQQPPRNY